MNGEGSDIKIAPIILISAPSKCQDEEWMTEQRRANLSTHSFIPLLKLLKKQTIHNINTILPRIRFAISFKLGLGRIKTKARGEWKVGGAFTMQPKALLAKSGRLVLRVSINIRSFTGLGVRVKSSRRNLYPPHSQSVLRSNKKY